MFSRSVMSDYLQPHGLQHTRLPCPPLSLAVCSNSCPLSLWCQPTISSSIVPFSCFQSFPASGPFPMSQLFASGGQSIGASATVLPMNIQGWFPLRLMVWSPYCPRNFQESSPAPQFKTINTLTLSLLYGPTLKMLFFKCFFSHIIAFWKKLPLPAFYLFYCFTKMIGESLSFPSYRRN